MEEDCELYFVQCNGGRVYFVEEREVNRFNQTKLKESVRRAWIECKKNTRNI